MLNTRTLSVASEAMPLVLGQPALQPVRLQGHESVNSLFEYELLLKTPDGSNLDMGRAFDFDLDGFIGREISCSIDLDGMGTFTPGGTGPGVDRLGAGSRQINAVIDAALCLGEEGGHVRYQLILRPWLCLAERNVDTRVFQNMTAVQILDELLARYPFPVDKRLHESYEVRDYQTQFNESDHEFFLRLTQENGISHFFEHAEGRHRLVLIDNLGAYKANPSAAYRKVDYHAPGWKTDAEYISRFVPHHQLTSGRYTTRDHDYTRPRADLTVSRSEPRPTGHADGEVYQWHDITAGAHYTQPRAGTADANDPLAEGRAVALLRMQALRTHGARARASGNLRGMVPGCVFRLAGYPREKANIDYLILETRLVVEDVGPNSQSKDAAPGRDQRWKVDVDFTVHPMGEPLRPALTQPKPLIHGPQIARVVGPAGQNIWTDQLGRIKVQFPWDRVGANDQHSSCWIRVSSSEGGNQRGGIHVPRIGQEVIVSFVGGDPDLPVCTGRLYNQINLPPWELPGQSALSGFRSRELTKEGGNSAAGRSNHLLMDDTPGEIQVQLKSDHLSSSLSTGYITRIDGHEGRKEARGEGIELRTDGHAAVRAAKGLLVTTEPRDKAARHVTDMGETTQRLVQAHDQHEVLGRAADQAQAQDRETDQADVTHALKAQNDAIAGHGSGSDGFPELKEPHLVLASPAGIETTTPRSTHIASGEHIALTGGKHVSLSAAASLLASAKEAIRLFACNAGMRLVAANADIDIRALKNSINLLAKLEITHTANKITITAKEEVEINGGTSYSRWNSAGIVHGTKGVWLEHASQHGTDGPDSLPVPGVNFPESASAAVCKDCLLKALAAGAPLGVR